MLDDLTLVEKVWAQTKFSPKNTSTVAMQLPTKKPGKTLDLKNSRESNGFN